MAEKLTELSIDISINAKDAQKELKNTAQQAQKSTKEIADNTEKNIKRADISMQGLANTLKRLALAYVSMSAFKATLESYTAFNTQLINANQLLGLETQSLAEMGRAMTRFGGNLESTIGALKSMNSHLQEAKFNGGALVDIARKYGIQISAYQKADKALLSLAKQMKGFSLETKMAIMSQLGLDEAMQRALIDGGAELERQIQKQRALGVETDEDIKLTKDFNEAMLDLKDIFSALAREMMRGIMPFLRGLVDKMIFFVDILRKNEIFVKGFFIGITIALMPILAILAKMAIATLTAFAPFIAIGVAVAGVAAIFEDLYYYFMGWDSATGELVKKFPHLKKVIDPLKPVIMGIMNVFSKIWALIKNPSWRAFGDTLKSIFTLPMDALQTLAEGLKSWFDSLGQMDGVAGAVFRAFGKGLEFLINGIQKVKAYIESLTWDKFKDDALRVFSAIGDFFTRMIEKITNAFSGITEKIKSFGNSISSFFGFGENETPQAQPQALQVPMSSAVTNNYGGRTTTINNNVNQNITSATPMQVATATTSAIQSVSAQIQQVGSN